MNKYIVIIISILSFTRLWAQEPKDTLNTEVISVVKPYSPTISDAFKVKDNPKTTEDDVEKKTIEYQINSVPVASTFTPSKGKAKSVKRPKKERLYDNYISVGFGNYTTPLIEAYMRTFPNRDAEIGMFLKHHSSQGGIKDVKLDDSFYDTDLNVYYKSSTRDKDFKIGLDASHRLFNWYGLNEDITFSDDLLSNIDPSQTYLGIGISGELAYYNSAFKGVKGYIKSFSDAYKGGEMRLKVEPKFELPISSELIKFDFDVDFLNGTMDRNYANDSGIAYSYLNLGVIPSFEVLRDNLSINLGAKLYYAFDFENSASEFKAYPSIDASYRVIDEVLTVFAGVGGGLHYNSYMDVSEDNPYMSPTFLSIPTDEKYNAFAGVKGKIASNMSYLFRGSYKDEGNKPMYILNQIKTDGTLEVNEAYELGNSFGVLYDDVTTIGFYGELAVDFSKEFTFGGNASYAIYDTKFQNEAWNLPNLKTTLFADYHANKWTANAKLFMVDKRMDSEAPYGIMTFAPEDYSVELETYVDLNLAVTYTFTERLSAFAKANNLLTTKYKRFINYPVQGIQVLGGITYKFDL